LPHRLVASKQCEDGSQAKAEGVSEQEIRNLKLEIRNGSESRNIDSYTNEATKRQQKLISWIPDSILRAQEGLLLQSARGLAQSKTLARRPGALERPTGFGLRRPSAAFAALSRCWSRPTRHG